MRREDRRIKDINEIIEVMKKCDVCSVAFYDKEFPYIIPLNFGVIMKEDTIELYFHGAKAGKKLELLRENNHIAFEMNCSRNLITGEKACDYTMEYESVCGNGILELLGEDEVCHGFDVIMSQYSSETKHTYDENVLKAVAILRLTVSEISGKRLKKG
jgi:nitroimidazol reductase NimA-like FMN-containing flavoprotein (pyridoxamine 5'-phosphate oxidase superfamily)